MLGWLRLAGLSGIVDCRALAWLIGGNLRHQHRLTGDRSYVIRDPVELDGREEVGAGVAMGVPVTDTL